MSHVLRFTVPNTKELIPPVKDTSSPIWSIMRELPIYKSDSEPIPDVIVDSIDSNSSQLLQTLNVSIRDLVL